MDGAARVPGGRTERRGRAAFCPPPIWTVSRTGTGGGGRGACGAGAGAGGRACKWPPSGRAAETLWPWRRGAGGRVEAPGGAASVPGEPALASQLPPGPHRKLASGRAQGGGGERHSEFPATFPAGGTQPLPAEPGRRKDASD